MRILMVIGQFYPIIGGAQRQCLKLSQALKERGHIVEVLTARNLRNVPRREVVEGISVERVWYPIFTVRGYRFGLGVLAPWFMVLAVLRKARRCDVVHVHQALWPLWSVLLARRAHRKRVVCKIGNSGNRFDLSVLRATHRYGRLAAWYVKRHTDKFVWTSTAIRNDLLREGVVAPKMVNIPNGVALPHKDAQRLRYTGGSTVSQDAPKIVFIFTGTFTLKKNLLSLLNAVHNLSPSYRNNITVVLLGDGPDRLVLTEAIKRDILEDTVEIQGPTVDVGAYLERSNVFILPSVTEGLSNSALEAMAHGLPVILSNVGGNRDLVDGNGILIDPTDIQSITAAIAWMVDHREIRAQMGERSRQIVEHRYTIDHVVQQYEQLYWSCLSSDLS